MVMIFADENARRQLLEKGFVYTFRTHQHKVGRDWATDKRGGRKICDIDIMLVKEIDSAEELIPFVDSSGFRNVYEWVRAIRRLNPKLREIQGFLYRVAKV
jgi:hypothetical protein